MWFRFLGLHDPGCTSKPHHPTYPPRALPHWAISPSTFASHHQQPRWNNEQPHPVRHDRNWGGQGMLGVTIRFDSFWRAEESLVRVLEVVPDSPAELAGLQAEDDYLLGTAEKVGMGRHPSPSTIHRPPSTPAPPSRPAPSTVHRPPSQPAPRPHSPSPSPALALALACPRLPSPSPLARRSSRTRMLCTRRYKSISRRPSNSMSTTQRPTR